MGMITLGQGNPALWEGDCLALGLHETVAGEEPWDSPDAQALAQVTGGWLQRRVDQGDIGTKVGKATVFFEPPGIKAKRLVVVGKGSKSKWDGLQAYRAAAVAAKNMADRPRQRVAFCGLNASGPIGRAAIIGAISGAQGQDLYRQEKSLHKPESAEWFGGDTAQLDAARSMAEGVRLTRELVNLPPNILYPQSFVDRALSELQSLPIDVQVWDESRLQQERCGAMLAVASGSLHPPRLLIARYRGDDSPPLAFVGKGVTFDSGGLSLKPTESMLTMKCDMAGAATVLGILKAAALMELKHHIVGAIGLVENMIGGGCYRLGDVLTARSGKTIEVHNTDAEGRLVLADVLDVTLESHPKAMIDFATLTGACVVALGTEIAGVMSNHEALQSKILDRAKACGELIWPLPMHSFFTEQIAGKVADIKNVGEGRWGGAITAAKFLEEFVGQVPWAHLDIAGPAFAESAKPWWDAGGTGVMVRTILEMLLADLLQ
jgi:leucyl aminopeptidase